MKRLFLRAASFFLVARVTSEALGAAQLPPPNASVGVYTGTSHEKKLRESARPKSSTVSIPPPPSTLAEEVRGLAGAWTLLHGRGRRHGVHVAKKQGCDPGTGHRRVPIDLL